MRTRTKVLAIAVGALAVLGGGTFAALRFLTAPVEDRAIRLVPRGAAFYATVYIQPSLNQQRAIGELLDKFPEAPEPDRARRALVGLLEGPLEEIGLDFGDDVAPWLGKQAAAFAMPPGEDAAGDPSFGLLLATTDEDATSAAIDEALASQGLEGELSEESYNGTEYRLEEEGGLAFGYKDGFLVAGAESAFKGAIDAAEVGSLEDSEGFQTATEALSDDHLALVYTDAGAVAQAARGAAAPGADQEAIEQLEELGAGQATAFVLYARPDAAVFESSYRIPESGPLAELAGALAEPGVVPQLPGGSWLAVGFPRSGETLGALLDLVAEADPTADTEQMEADFRAQTGLDLRGDVLAWMGNAGFFVQGEGIASFGGGAVVESSDPAQTVATVRRIAELLSRQGVQIQPLEREGAEGFSVQAPGAPAPINVLGGEKLVIAYTSDATDAALSPNPALSETDAFGRAAASLGGGFNVASFVDIQTVIEVVENTVPQEQLGAGYRDDVKPWIEPLAHLVAGAGRAGDTLVTRVVVGTR